MTGTLRGWHQVPEMTAGAFFSLSLFLVVLGLGVLQPRFWCKYVCPTGALFSLSNVFRATERKVEATCINCNKCVEICPFDAIKPDFLTRTTDCTFCQTCGGVCPVHSIKFVARWDDRDVKAENDPPTGETALGRRSFLATASGLLAGTVGGAGLAAIARGLETGNPSSVGAARVRPPGSVPEPLFQQLCIRCGACFQACPNDVLQPVGLEGGFADLWTPQVVADWSGCEPSCTNCGQVCPTGAIRALPLDEKRFARMGLAIVDQSTCLPFAQMEECQLCVDECQQAGYDAIEFMRVGGQQDPFAEVEEDAGFLAPVVVADKCVGCGLCQTRCYKINVASRNVLARSAIIVEAGPGREDRLTTGSYAELDAQRQQQRTQQQRDRLPNSGAGDSYLPDFLQESP
jgi:MauM/NapG family ferredoxin protein